MSNDAAKSPPGQSALRQYESVPSRYDEMLDAASRPRPHWSAFLTQLSALSVEAMGERARFVQDAVASDGVTYNVYADPKGASRPWELDLLPMILPATEWRAISAAVAQRARLLNAVLCDLYGPQTLLSEGLVPPALVFGQRSFLWPLHGVSAPGGVALHLYAADLARAPDGSWWILGDRTRGPSGAGYALQNRITISRAFADAFRELHVEPLAPFFGALQDCLHRLSPRGGDAPLAVLLTPGPYNETYFEHAFLARFLGFPLVEGQDLIVRGDRVFLKTLRGLRQVHAILRRLDDEYCDPVELRADSALGVPGLVHVIRAGNVIVANALGSALLETGALSGFYPAVSERLLGERLLMPSIATWWCGEAPALDYVLGHLDDLVIKPAYPSMQMEPVFGHALDASGRAGLVQRLQAQPHAYVAQEWVRLSHVPAWESDGARFVSRATSLRVFAVATANGYAVMPGGLTRIAPHDGDVVSMQWGGSSKDTWMLADRPVIRSPLRRPRLGVEDVTRSVVEIASRVGENLFWMGRYAERCEGLARLLRAALTRVADADPEEQPALASLATAQVRLEVFANIAEVDFVKAATDPAISNGLAANVLRLVACANQVRERMSTDNWHVLNRLQQRLPGEGAELGTALESLDEIMLACVSLAGFAMDDMTRDESWQFLLLGRRLERLAHLAGVIAHVAALDPESRTEALEWLLEAANSIVTYRARFRRAPELLPVLHLVVFDESNPHSVAFQLRETGAILQRIANELGSVSVASLESSSRALSRVSLAGFEPESGAVLERSCRELAELLEHVERSVFALSDDLQRQFFTHTATPAPVGIGAP
jgi:uncharacterized circularly permuted ATP-grasp superfamily protein/uncharacterized alpha-E superfamily protein